MSTVLYDDTTTCNRGHKGARRRVIQTPVPGTKPAKVLICDECDRAKCFTCKKPILNVEATFCPCGGQTWPLTSQQGKK